MNCLVTIPAYFITFNRKISIKILLKYPPYTHIIIPTPYSLLPTPYSLLPTPKLPYKIDFISRSTPKLLNFLTL
ncbi:hypothetical protein [Moorena sp. SIOASIH]|uniref:hypothetical protein n=1 Tax=Moorena sp. SIOASIH TaxID=2607817 RepID=UPI0026010EB9|nr:hypothetical protein [Moorena sp. SIOASIH]